MATTRILFYPTAVTQATGEGDISTGLSPLAWGPLGVSFTAGSSSGTTVTRNFAFTDYNRVSGDQLVITGGTGITLGTYTIASKTNSNSIVLSTSPGTTGTNITAYILRSSLAGALADYPTTLPGADDFPNLDLDHICSYFPRDGLTNQQTKILRYSSFKRVGDDVDIVTALTALSPTSITGNFGIRMSDFYQDGSGQPYRIQAAFRNSGGQIGSSWNSNQLFTDGGGGPGAAYTYYIQPGSVGGMSLSLSSITSSFGFNFAINHDSGDANEACSLLSVNGLILTMDVTTSSTITNSRYLPVQFGPAYRRFLRG